MGNPLGKGALASSYLPIGVIHSFSQHIWMELLAFARCSKDCKNEIHIYPTLKSL